MAGVSTDQGLPYPTLSDAPDGPAQLLALLQAIERRLVRVYESSADRASRAVSPVEGAMCWQKDKDRFEFRTAAGVWVPMPYGSICKVRDTTATPIPNNAWTPVSFETTDQDDDAYHPAGLPTRLVAPWTGWYLLTGTVSFSSTSATGRRGAQWFVNGSSLDAGSQYLAAAGGSHEAVAPTLPQKLTAGQFVELNGYQDSGAATTTNAAVGVGAQASAQIAWLRP